MNKRKYNREGIDYWFLGPRCRHCKAHINWKLLPNEKYRSITYNSRLNLSNFMQSCKYWPNYTPLMIPTYIKFVGSQKIDKMFFLINSGSSPNTKYFTCSKEVTSVYYLEQIHSPYLSISVVNGCYGCSCPKILYWGMHTGKNHSDKGYK